MAHGKDPSPLFEIIHRSPRASRRGVRVPDWMRHADAMEKEVSAAEPTVSATAGPRAAWLNWWSRPVRFRLQLGVLVMFGIAVMLAVVVAMFVGMELQKRRAADLAMKWALNEREIEDLQERDPNYGLVPRTVERASSVGEGLRAPPSSAGAAGRAEDPRVPGLNYFRLVELPGSAMDEGLRAIEFLRSNQIDAALIPVNNGRSYKLMALRGFERIGNAEAKAYRDRLETLGRLWKARHKGSSDWHDLIAEKYVPGRT
jgi:hypothetical protein